MLPPVLEIYLVWHPGDSAGAELAKQISSHFHGTTFSGLLGGAIEVYHRSAAWTGAGGSPRPIPFPDAPPPNGVAQAELTIVVPMLGNSFASAVEANEGGWRDFALEIRSADERAPARVGIFPLRIHRSVDIETRLGRIFAKYERIGESGPGDLPEPQIGLICRDLAQGIAQLVTPGRIQVFISHTKQAADAEDVLGLVEAVRKAIARTKLRAYFDQQDVQPGEDWDAALRENASSGVMLALRTDKYASREWCQREMVLAKRYGVPIVIADSLGIGEERGSYLLDHVARIPVNRTETGWSTEPILRCLNLLVDECMKRALWQRQQNLAQERPDLQISWWAPHAPEMLTLVDWLAQVRANGGPPAEDDVIRILHPDPPLGPEEVDALKRLASLAGFTQELDIMTPRLLASRGG